MRRRCRGGCSRSAELMPCDPDKEEEESKRPVVEEVPAEVYVDAGVVVRVDDDLADGSETEFGDAEDDDEDADDEEAASVTGRRKTSANKSRCSVISGSDSWPRGALSMSSMKRLGVRPVCREAPSIIML